MAGPWEKYAQAGPWTKYQTLADNSQPTQFEKDRISPVGLVPVQRDIARASGKTLDLSGVEPTAEGKLVPRGTTASAMPVAAANNMLYPGTGTAASGVSDIAKGNIAKGSHKVISGGFDALSTATPAFLEAAPLKLGKALLGGTIGSEVGSRGASAVGANEDQAALAGDIGGAVGGAAALGSGKVLEKFPSVERAGQTFQSVSKSANGHTVSVTPELSDALFKYQNLVDSGGSRSLAVSKLLNRLTSPDKGPLTYEEARLFQSNISRLSADETQRLTPVMKRQVGQIAGELNKAVENTTASVGQLDNFRSAMKEYSQAKTNEARMEVLKKWGIKAGAAAALWELRE
jgi:hypothetical protein